MLHLRELKGIGILATGEIRCNGLLGCKLKSEKEMRKEEPGALISRGHKREMEGKQLCDSDLNMFTLVKLRL